MTETFVESRGARLWTSSHGRGFPVMLYNGGPGCCDYLAPVSAMIEDMAQVIRVEQRGCSRSEPMPPYDVATCLLDLEQIRRHYRLERWIIGGHSWRADLALAYALDYARHSEHVLARPRLGQATAKCQVLTATPATGCRAAARPKTIQKTGLIILAECPSRTMIQPSNEFKV